MELLTVMAIFAVVSAIVLANYHGFGRKTALKNLAYNIALAIREAQVSGITGRNVETVGGDYYSSYGMYFSASTPKEYIFFKDRPTLGNQFKYDNTPEELVGDYKILSDHSITKLCVFNTPSGACNNVAELNITFRRPQPDAHIYTGSGHAPMPEAAIEVSSSDGDKLYVVVSATGQISVQKTL